MYAFKTLKVKLNFMCIYIYIYLWKYFSYLGSMITNDARCAREFNPGLSWQKQHSTARRLFSPAN